MSFTGLVIVCLVAVLAPLLASAIPRVRIPGIVLACGLIDLILGVLFVIAYRITARATP